MFMCANIYDIKWHVVINAGSGDCTLVDVV